MAATPEESYRFCSMCALSIEWAPRGVKAAEGSRFVPSPCLHDSATLYEDQNCVDVIDDSIRHGTGVDGGGVVL